MEDIVGTAHSTVLKSEKKANWLEEKGEEWRILSLVSVQHTLQNSNQKRKGFG